MARFTTLRNQKDIRTFAQAHPTAEWVLEEGWDRNRNQPYTTVMVREWRFAPDLTLGDTVEAWTKFGITSDYNVLTWARQIPFRALCKAGMFVQVDHWERELVSRWLLKD